MKLSDVDAVKMADKPLVGTVAVSTTKSAAHGDWIDLGNEGETLYLSAELTVTARGQSAALSLATSSNQARVTIGITADGKLTAGLFEHETESKELKAGEKFTLLARIVSRCDKPDELFIKLAPVGGVPPEPQSVDGWTLINLQGESQANLSRLILNDDPSSPAFTHPRVAATHAALA